MIAVDMALESQSRTKTKQWVYTRDWPDRPGGYKYELTNRPFDAFSRRAETNRRIDEQKRQDRQQDQAAGNAGLA